MAPVAWSDASEVLGLRWDDGSFVVDPENILRGNRGLRDDHDGGRDGTLINHLEPDHGALTLEEWRKINAYDPGTRTYDIPAT